MFPETRLVMRSLVQSDSIFVTNFCWKKDNILRPTRGWEHDIKLIINKYDKEAVGWINMAKNEGK